MSGYRSDTELLRADSTLFTADDDVQHITVFVTSGVFAIDGKVSVLTKALSLITRTGVYVLSVKSAIIGRAYILNTSVGVYALSGESALLHRNFEIVTLPKFYTINGKDVDLSRGRVLDVTCGQFILSGPDVTLNKDLILNTELTAYIAEAAQAYFQTDRKDTSTTGRLVVIKNFHIPGATGEIFLNIDGYAHLFAIDKMVITLISGTPTEIKAGWSSGSQDIINLTDLSFLQPNKPTSLSIEQVPPEHMISLYINLFSAVYTIDLLLIRRIGATYEGDTE